MTLSYNLKPLQNAFVFQVVDQDKDFGNYVKTSGPFYASNGWKVALSEDPEVDVSRKVIYLRGSNSKKDLKVDRVYNLSSNSLRDKIMYEIDQALAESVNWFKTRNSKPVNTNKNPFANVNRLDKFTCSNCPLEFSYACYIWD